MLVTLYLEGHEPIHVEMSGRAREALMYEYECSKDKVLTCRSTYGWLAVRRSKVLAIVASAQGHDGEKPPSEVLRGYSFIEVPEGLKVA